MADCRLRLDGYKLHLMDGDSLIKSWNAVSRSAGLQSPAAPTGRWSFSLSDVQVITLRDHAFGSAMKLLYNLSAGSSLFKHGSWFGGAMDWGLERVFLVPADGTDAVGRDRLSIHGGDVYGAAGGIDLGHDEVDFFRSLTERGLDNITLDVDDQSLCTSPHPLAGQFLGAGPGSRGLSPTDHLGKPVSVLRPGAATLATSSDRFADLFGHPFNGSPDDVDQLAGAIADGRIQPAVGYVDTSNADRYAAPFFTDSSDKIVISADASSWCASIVRNGEIERIIQYYKHTFRFRQVPA